MWSNFRSPNIIRAAKFCTRWSLLTFDLLVLDHTVEQYNSLLKTKAFINSRSVSLSKRCLILFICTNLQKHLAAVWVRCSSYVKYWSMKTPRSRATGTGVISFPKMEMATLGTRRRSWGTPLMRIFVLSALINKEFWQHQLQVLLKSSCASQNKMRTRRPNRDAHGQV